MGLELDAHEPEGQREHKERTASQPIFAGDAARAATTRKPNSTKGNITVEVLASSANRKARRERM